MLYFLDVVLIAHFLVVVMFCFITVAGSDRSMYKVW